MARVDPLGNTEVPRSIGLPRPRQLRMGQTVRARIGRVLTYTLLLIGAIIMFFPMFWMFTASFKPQWQIFTSPPIWIPSEWITVQAGNTTEEIPTWYATDSSGQRRDVIKVGTRRYTNALDVSALKNVQSVPSTQLSSAQPTAIGNLMINVRTWTPGTGSAQQVIALGRDGDNLIIAPVESLGGAIQQVPLDILNTAKRTNVKAGDFSLQAREIDSKAVLPLGPETQLTLGPPKGGAPPAILGPAK